MTRYGIPKPKARIVLCSLLTVTWAARCIAEGPTPAANRGFDEYTARVESQLAVQHRSGPTFLAGIAADGRIDARLRRGEVVVEHLIPQDPPDMPGAQLHHWRGTAFAPGATAADFENLLRDFEAYPQNFSPEVLDARVLGQDGDRVRVEMRVRQRHVITVTMETTYEVTFGKLDARHGFSTSRSSGISEIDGRGRRVPPGEDHGFLWRLNSYWSYEERDDGLFLQIESVSLTRSAPAGLGWAVGPYVDSIPRESLEFTLRSACNALRHSVLRNDSEGTAPRTSEGRQP
jgi:hypothetical protein